MINRLEVVTGPMCAGKSEALATACLTLAQQGLRVGAFQPEKNTRDDGIVSRTGTRVPAGKIATLEEIDMKRVDAVIIDEIHLFEDTRNEVTLCRNIRNAGKLVLVGVLDYDYRGILMPAYEDLIEATPDHIDWLKARCSEPVGCSEPAPYTALLIDGAQQSDGEQIIVDDFDTERLAYSPRCTEHFLPLYSNKNLAI